MRTVGRPRSVQGIADLFFHLGLSLFEMAIVDQPALTNGRTQRQAGANHARRHSTPRKVLRLEIGPPREQALLISPRERENSWHKPERADRVCTPDGRACNTQISIRQRMAGPHDLERLVHPGPVGLGPAGQDERSRGEASFG